jgi:hypothetical protein
MKYFVRTAFGSSTNSFENTFLHLILGLLQGSATVGAIWANNSSIQLNVLAQICPPVIFPSLQPELYTTRNGEAFVNDTTLWDTPYTASLHYVAARMAAKAQAWEQIMHAVGRYLNLLKTFYFAISLKFCKNGQLVMRTIAEDPDINIQLTQGNHRANPQSINCIEVNKGK